MTPDDGLEALLGEHAGWTFNDISDDYECICGEQLGYQCQSDYAANKAQWKHQAAVVRAAGWRKTKAREEWGVQTVHEKGNVWTDPYVFRHTAERHASGPRPGKLVRRTRLSYTEFTDWEEA